MTDSIQPDAPHPVQCVALLHSINLGQRRKVGMAVLRDLFVRLGHLDAQTYIQSGNVLFSAATPAADLRPSLEAALEAEFGFAIPVTLRTAAQWQELVAACPPELRTEAVSVGVLGAAPEPEALARLRGRDVAPERWAVVGTALYQTVPTGVRQLKLSHAVIQRVLGVTCTVRNWRTVQALAGRLEGR